MTGINHLPFLQKKLGQVKNAVMYNMNNEIVKLPNDVVQFVRMDNEGLLWFSIRRPKYWVTLYDTCFPVRLCFYQKGLDYYIEASGVAIMADMDETKRHQHEIAPGCLLMKMTPISVEYSENPKKNRPTSLAKWWNYLLEHTYYKIPTHNTPQPHN